MALNKETSTFGMPWEMQYGYVQAVKVDDTIYMSGQLSHDDDGNMVGAAPLDDSGNIRDHSNMEIQMRQTYGSQIPPVASTILVTPRLALPTQLIEIKFIARLR